MVTRNWHRLAAVCCLCLALVVGDAGAADVEPSITLLGSDEAVYLGDSVMIELESVGLDEAVDTSPLLKEAELLRETVGTRIMVISDQVVEMKLRRMELLPQRQGRIIFGPLNGNSFKGGVTSNSITIDVQAPTELQWQPDTDDLQIDVTLRMGDGASQISLPTTRGSSDATRQAFVGQHIIADIELRHRFPIADEQVSLPDFAGFDVLEQFVERRTIDERDDEPSWRLTAWRYHLFARHSGTLSLNPVSWTGTVIRSRTQRAVFDKSTSPLVLQIQPAADSSHWWLPASDLSVSDSWSRDPRELSAGDEILRTITLSARDVLANHLPDIVPPESRALTTTPIRQSRSQQLQGEHIMATAIFEFRMIAQSPIPVFLDTVRVPWYDTVTASAREAIIPARRINVGLPDRADLLASLALDGNWFDRMLLRLEGSSTARSLPWQAILALLCLLAAWLWIQELRYWRHERRQRKEGLKSTALPEL